MMSHSKEWYQRARKVIPWGTQTNSKRPDESLAGVMPFYIERGEGCRIQDVDGNWYIDYRAALGPVILGYCHPEVDAAVRKQMEKGVLFSMASPVEVEVAEQLTEMIPALDQVRFMKTGHEANLAAVRLARAYTGRDMIATCGYHGHSDWFVCGSGEGNSPWPRERNGVPALLDSLVTRIPYGDTDTAERIIGEYGERLAAVIMVPYDWNEEVPAAFVKRMRELTAEQGILLIFDEVLTGFRLATAGAREYFGVIPDLTTYAKAVANGYPLSVFGGRKEVMHQLDEHVIITITHGGETLSLAAANVVLRILREEPVVEHIWAMGERLSSGFNRIAGELDLSARAIGLPPAVQFRFSGDAKINTRARALFFRELYKQGIFASLPFLLTYAHQTGDIDETLEAMRNALLTVAESQQLSDVI